MSDFVAKLTEENILFYVAGYLIKKMSLLHQCKNDSCSIPSLEAECRMFVNSSQTFSYHKTLQPNKSDFGGLKVPSELFFAFVTALENLFQKEINGISHLDNIISRLSNKTATHVVVQLPICDLAYSQLLRLFFITRLHAAAKFFSRDICSITPGKKNRKATKVMHL